ncbi:MAG TPA: twin-arginine translocase TatA/TatE family subunit [Pyrinomonadaceae bacterium]|nr:twin-arginine translocase TatA/TatE family subunit [Pyrinomonadaceae bacterium]
MVFLILESLGSTEFAFILVMALVFFGPRKLPQLSRTIGKNLANFRKASEDFKSTWDREVTLEELNMSRMDMEPGVPAQDHSLLDPESQPTQPSLPTIEPVETDRVVPRKSPSPEAKSALATIETVEPSSKRDWL